MKKKKRKKKKTRKQRRKKKIRRKSRKNTSKISFKKIKNIKISKQLKQLNKIKLLIKSKKKKIIDNQIKLLKGISLKRLANFTSQSLNKVYEDFKREQKINKLKRIKLEKREKAKQFKKIRKETNNGVYNLEICKKCVGIVKPKKENLVSISN